MILYQKKEAEKFPHRLFPGAPIQTIEDLQKHKWVYVLRWHKAIHTSVLMNQQATFLLWMLQRDDIREALEMRDEEVILENKLGETAAKRARIEYRERLFDHASAIHGPVDGVSEDNDYTVVGEATGG